ncbi:hypothetical protein [Paraconexibacter algicola]|uniref:Uncharacterized protein n=1 Tax=Paraconexibacter algicola TaxID=2133960 RepID=A0A2T4UCY8_9ACTN|nr:hypothetical protein [Paraconexibacter algicola]PTL55371.1 hypothetical protein C7Y72_17055 [Paraconexibacter algicola]
MTDGAAAQASERELVLIEFDRLNRDQKYDFAKTISGLSVSRRSKADELENAVREGLRNAKVDYAKLVRFVAEQAFLGRQHVWPSTVPSTVNDLWKDPAEVRRKLTADGHDVLGMDEPIAAPRDLSLASVSHDGTVFEITAAGRRTTRRRNHDEEARLQSQVADGMTAVVYETIQIRAWVRLRWNVLSGTADLHIGQLGRDSDYGEVLTQFLDLLPWLPFGHFVPLALSSVVHKLHVQAETEQNGGVKGETRLQGVNYDTGGVRSTHRSRASDQSVVADHADVVNALALLRKHGVAARGNCWWRPNGEGGIPAAAVLRLELHTDIAAEYDRVNLKRPVSADELEFLLARLRALAI